MLTKEQLRENAAQKLASAKILLANQCHDDAAYLAGYAVEFQLKARIVEHRNLGGFPSTDQEFDDLKNQHGLKLKVHELHQLLVESGQDTLIKTTYFADWSTCETWNPESRYFPVGTVSPPAAANILRAVEELLKHL